MAGNFMAVSPFLKAQSLGTNYTSQSFNVSYHDRFAIQVKIHDSDTLSGNLKMQVSIDDVDFVDVSDATFSVNGDDKFIISVTQFAYRFIRLVWTRTAGSGSLDADINTVNLTR